MSEKEWVKAKIEGFQGDVLQYTACGLDDIFLLGGFTRHETRYGRGVSIENVEGLHRAIAMSLVDSERTLTGEEARFLRKEIKLTQAELAKFMKLNEQSVARWEKGETAIAGSTEILLRGLYREHIGETLSLKKLAQKVEASIQSTHRQAFEPHPGGWHAQAA
jgi:putative transcriptional regulator